MTVYQVQSNGNAPAQAQIGDIIVTEGGNYQIVAPNTAGASYNEESGFWSVKANSNSGNTNPYAIDYNDNRFTQVEADKQSALNDINNIYGGMIDNTDNYYQAQIDASKEWADKQTALQQEQSDFAIEQLEYQKKLAEQDYIKEQSASYVDWQKQSNKYGANAEQIAAQGLANSGYSESSQVSMYNTYQNRVATARESYNRAVTNYNIAIKDARLQNNAALAEIAYQALQAQLELSLEGFQYKNSLIMAQADKKLEIENMYYNRYQDVLDQINTENALAESIRQYEQNYALQLKEYEEGIRQFNEELALAKSKSSSSRNSGGSGGGIDIAPSGSGFTGSTYGEAVEYMKKNGVSNEVASSIYTKNEWTRRKASYNKTGTGSKAVELTDSYAEYLAAIVEDAIERANK